MTIHEIEQAIKELSPGEMARFRKWFEEFDAQAWDEQFERDVKSGKLDKLANNMTGCWSRNESNLRPRN